MMQQFNCEVITAEARVRIMLKSMIPQLLTPAAPVLLELVAKLAPMGCSAEDIRLNFQVERLSDAHATFVPGGGNLTLRLSVQEVEIAASPLVDHDMEALEHLLEVAEEFLSDTLRSGFKIEVAYRGHVQLQADDLEPFLAAALPKSEGGLSPEAAAYRLPSEDVEVRLLVGRSTLHAHAVFLDYGAAWESRWLRLPELLSQFDTAIGKLGLVRRHG